MLDKNCKCCNLIPCSGISKLNIIDLRIINNKRAPNHQQLGTNWWNDSVFGKYFNKKIFPVSFVLWRINLTLFENFEYFTKTLLLAWVYKMFLLIRDLFLGVRQEQDIYVRLIDSVTKQVRILVFNVAPILKEHSFIMLSIKLQSEVLKGVS